MSVFKRSASQVHRYGDINTFICTLSQYIDIDKCALSNADIFYLRHAYFMTDELRKVLTDAFVEGSTIYEKIISINDLCYEDFWLGRFVRNIQKSGFFYN